MFTVRKKFEIESFEVMDFVRLLGRFGLKFKVSDERAVEVGEGKPPRHYRCFVVFGSRRQIGELLDARDIVCEYNKH